MYFNWYEFYESDTIKEIFAKDLNTNAKIFKIALMSDIEEHDLNLLEHSYRISNLIAETYNAETFIDQNPDYFPNIESVEKEKYQLIDGELFTNLEPEDESEMIVQEICVVKNESPISSIITVCLSNENSNITVH